MTITLIILCFRSMTREEAAENGKEFAITVNCYNRQQTWQPEQVEACLRTRTTEELFEAYDKGTFRSRGSVDNFSDFPPMMPDLPETRLAEGKFNKVPILVGSNSGEGVLNSGRYILRPQLLDEDFVEPATTWDEDLGPFYIFDRIPALNKSDFGACDVEVAKAARQFYFQDNITSEDLQQFINLNTDVQFWFGTDKMIKYLSPHTPVYQYILYFQDLFSISTNPNSLGRNLGVCHADDLFYMWDMYGLNAELGLLDTWWSQANKLNSKRMLELWTNFIKYLDPTPPDHISEVLEKISWTQVTESEHSYLKIDSELSMDMSEEYRQRMEFWQEMEALCNSLQ